MPSIADRSTSTVDMNKYEPVPSNPVTTLSPSAPVNDPSPGQSIFMRTTLPPVWQTSPDSLRTYFNGGVVSQNRIVNPTPPPIVNQQVTNTTNKITKVTNINTDPTQGFTSGSNADGFWEKDPLGIVTQWGQVNTDINSGTLPITFPIPFPTTIEMILVTTWSPTDRITYVVKGSESLTGFTIGNNGSSGFAYWEAKGR
jgi:hypothetical protein